MGCGASTNSSKVLAPQTNRDMMIEARLVPLLNPNHELNVNKKYTYLYTVVPDEFVNKGIHRTNKYVSVASQAELSNKKIEFWGGLTRFASGRQ